ncbi:MAG: T9SS type A sorting domain-containing protein, partial [Bacteroidota bacterium]|nr:T9SS type A sorting domain-containing protein [Bacteroidota bacterium]
MSGVSLPDSSYAYSGRPEYFPGALFPSIGLPHAEGSGSIPAEERYRSGMIVPIGCRGDGTSTLRHLPSRPDLAVYPNPARETIVLRSPPELRNALYVLRDILGRVVASG